MSGYSRVIPRARSGTTGISDEFDLRAGEAVWVNPPDRIQSVSVAVNIPSGATATYTVEVCFNRAETIGENGSGGYWYNLYGDNAVMSEQAVTMTANAVTGIRVRCITASQKINVCFVG